MKQRLGIILILTGMILLINPEFEFNILIIYMKEFMIRYWPICLVVLGIALVNKRQGKHKRSIK